MKIIKMVNNILFIIRKNIICSNLDYYLLKLYTNI